MAYKRTTEVPNDPVKAKAIYDDIKKIKLMTIMVIIGNTVTFKDAITKADNLAGVKDLKDLKTTRWVLWVKDHDIVRSTLALILAESKAERSNREFDEIKCFCLSPKRHDVEGIILKNGTLDYVSLRLSFLKAERHDLELINS